MGILDDAIKEHLELKRQHGAEASELKQLEDDAFGATERPGDESSPDPAAEAPTEFMQQPGLEQGEDVEPAPEAEAPAGEEPAERLTGRAELADLQEAPGADSEPEAAPADAPPAEEESPAMEHDAIPEPQGPIEPTGPSTEEREAIAEQPTEMYDLEEELAAAQPEAEAEEELVAEEGEEEEDDDFWDEKRLSDELDQALEAPIEDEEELAPPPPVEPAPASEAETPEPAPEPESAPEPDDSATDTPDEDVLEETPEFLEEAPEADRLWFEQKPPKDFDFDD